MICNQIVTKSYWAAIIAKEKEEKKRKGTVRLYVPDLKYK